MRPSYKVTELLGDGIGPELSAAVHSLAQVLPIQLDFEPVDFSLENRRAKKTKVYDEAVASITANKVLQPSTPRSPLRKAPTRSCGGASISRSSTAR